jgi:hypothetical protein
MHITAENASDILVRVCLGFWRFLGTDRVKKPGKLRLSRQRNLPRVPCDRKPRFDNRSINMPVVFCAMFIVQA